MLQLPESVDSESDENVSNEYNDFDSKIVFARRILQACTDKQINGSAIAKYGTDEKFKYYTGASPKLLGTVKQNRKERVTFFDILTVPALESKDVTLNTTLHEIITDFYINKRIVPNMHDITEEYAKKFKIESITCEFLSSALEMNCIHLPGTQKCIILENAQLLHERHDYLRKMKQYRLEKRCILYLCDKVLKETFPNWKAEGTNRNILIVASPSFGLPFYSLFSWRTVVNKEQWILINVIPKLPDNCVMVIASSDRPPVPLPPNETSKKTAMLKWLSEHNIPHDPTWHRGELYALIGKSKNKFGEEISEPFSEMLKGYCHDVVYTPRELPMLSYSEIAFDKIRRDIASRITTRRPYAGDVIDEIENYPTAQWKEFERQVIEMEDKVFRDDNEIDEIADKLVMMAKDGMIPDEDLSRLQDYKEGFKRLIDSNVIITH